MWTYDCKRLPHEPGLKNVITMFQYRSGSTLVQPVKDFNDY